MLISYLLTSGKYKHYLNIMFPLRGYYKNLYKVCFSFPKMDFQVLKNIGLSEGEIKTYLALLKLNYSSIGNIVREAKVTKSKVYDILDRLISKGLVSTSLKNGVKYYGAAPPDFLLELLQNKEKEIKKQEKDIQKLIPSLLALQIPSEENRVEIFEGFQGLKNAFQVIENEFKTNEKFLVVGVENTLNQQQLNFFLNFHNKKIKSKIKTKVIFTENLKGVNEYHPKKNEYNQERFLDQSSAIPINIYRDIVIIPIIKKDEEEITILIRNKNLAEGFRQYFYTLWKIAKK